MTTPSPTTPEMVEKVTRTICMQTGQCKYHRNRCNTGRCTLSPDVGKAAIAAHTQALEEAGFAIVPVAVSPEMHAAAIGWGKDYYKVWQAMVNEARK